MKRILVACFLLAGCAPQRVRRAQYEKERFEKTDQEFAATPTAAVPKIFVDTKEMVKEMAPPYRFVGVVEVEGIMTEQLSVVYRRVAKAGARFGCEAMLQRDAFQGTTAAPFPALFRPGTQHSSGDKAAAEPGGGGSGGGGDSILAGSGGTPYHNDMGIWQFLCGVGGATEDQAEASFKKANLLAVAMRAKAIGFEPCWPYVPLGSHLRQTRVCADDPRNISRPAFTGWEH